jgi:hypothetical protein
LFVLKRARLGMKNRENMRFARTRIYGLVRELLRALGARLADEEILAEPEDIFYLTIDEVWDYIKGTAVTTQLARIADLRRHEFDSYRNDPQPPAERFFTYGMVDHKNRFQCIENTAPVADGTLRGIGVCAGEVTAKTKIVHNPSDDVTLSREILLPNELFHASPGMNHRQHAAANRMKIALEFSGMDNSMGDELTVSAPEGRSVRGQMYRQPLERGPSRTILVNPQKSQELRVVERPKRSPAQLDARELCFAEVDRDHFRALGGERQGVVARRGDRHDALSRRRLNCLTEDVGVLPTIRVTNCGEVNMAFNTIRHTAERISRHERLAL